MIDAINNQFLSIEQRRDILLRAQNSQPFFHLQTFALLAEVLKRQQYSNVVAVNKPFFLTEIIGNFGEVFQTAGTFFDVSIYSTLEQKSIWNYLKGIPIPSGQIATEARFNTAFANQLFDDRQFEYMPRLIRQGDKIVSEIVPQDTKAAPDTVKMVLKGYYVLTDAFYNARALQGINESLADKIHYETWKVEVNQEGVQTLSFTNDRTARLVLGFGIVDKTTVKADLAASTVMIRDTFRELKFSNLPLPVEFIAPRLTALRDASIYFLPTEYLFLPFASLQMEFNTELNGGNGFEFVMLTRTV